MRHGVLEKHGSKEKIQKRRVWSTWIWIWFDGNHLARVLETESPKHAKGRQPWLWYRMLLLVPGIMFIDVYMNQSFVTWESLRSKAVEPNLKPLQLLPAAVGRFELLRIFPGMYCNATEVHSNHPLERGLHKGGSGRIAVQLGDHPMAAPVPSAWSRSRCLLWLDLRKKTTLLQVVEW